MMTAAMMIEGEKDVPVAEVLEIGGACRDGLGREDKNTQGWHKQITGIKTQQRGVTESVTESKPILLVAGEASKSSCWDKE